MKRLAFLILALCAGAACANDAWLNTGFATYHFQSDKNLNGKNPGLGAEYRINEESAVTLGRFYNSDRQHSNYAGVYYQPWTVAGVRLGAVFGCMSLLACHDLCPKDLPLQTQIAFLRRKMVVAGLK